MNMLYLIIALIAVGLYFSSESKEGFYYNDFTLLNDQEFSLEKRRRFDTIPNRLFVDQFDTSRRVTCSTPRAFGNVLYCTDPDTLPIMLPTTMNTNINPDTVKQI